MMLQVPETCGTVGVKDAHILAADIATPIAAGRQRLLLLVIDNLPQGVKDPAALRAAPAFLLHGPVHEKAAHVPVLNDGGEISHGLGRNDDPAIAAAIVAAAVAVNGRQHFDGSAPQRAGRVRCNGKINPIPENVEAKDTSRRGFPIQRVGDAARRGEHFLQRRVHDGEEREGKGMEFKYSVYYRTSSGKLC